MKEIVNIVKVEFDYLPVINFAMQQNRISVVRHITLENLTENEIKDIEVCIKVEPNFANANSIKVDTLAIGKTIRLENVDLNLSPNYFAQLTERLAGNIVLEITSQSEIVFKQTYPIDILAYDQWGGLSILPEIISAFITPNHPATIPIIKRAAAILEQWTGNASFDEYQSRNPDRVRKQMAAIYTAISEQNIIYSTIPTSFEEYGQRIRLIDAVTAQKLGTCLDMTLLYASCLESIGIHPLIVMMQNHAFVGAWLIPETFPDNIVDDVSYLTKRTADGINEIAVVETTCMNNSNGTDFDQAVKIANGKLIHTSDFILAIDVKRNRYSGIRPLPQRIQKGLHWEIEIDESPVKDKSQTIPQNVNPYDLSGVVSEEIVLTKQLLWERKLLDLSLRNNLLNIRITKNTLQLIPPDLARFEDALAKGTEFNIISKPIDWNNSENEYGLYQSIAQSDPIVGLLESNISQKRLHSYLPESDLNKALTHLYRSSRTSMEENGANTLYMALGLLRWYETPTSERPRYAPLLLLPIEMIRKSAAKGFIIRSREEETMMNITLLEMLRQNFNITVQGLDPLPLDESGVDLRLIYTIVRNAIKDQKGWDVEEQAILGIFSFSKFIMWNDIHSNSHKLIENPIVSSLMNGKIEWNVDDDMADASMFDIDLSPSDILLPISADSSQLEAIYEAVNNKSFILHGPPGTGKSQTITNIIANALYRGKRVLFVAEKMAALSVVQNRLAAIGLSPFCLELHSNKTKKTAILDQLKVSTEVVKHNSPENFEQESVRLHNLRSELNAYIQVLHKKYPFGLSIHDAIPKYQSIKENQTIDIPLSLFDDLTPEKIREWTDAIELVISTSNACGHPHNHPLTGIKISSYSSTIKEEGAKRLSETETVLKTLKTKLFALSDLLGDTEPNYDRKQIEIIITIIQKLLQIPELTATLLTQSQLNETLDEYITVVSHGKERDQSKHIVTTDFSTEILNIDATRLLNDWNLCLNQWFVPKYVGQRSIKKKLKAYSVNNAIDTDKVKTTLIAIIKYKDEKAYIDQYTSKLPQLFGKYARYEHEDWATIEQIIDDTLVINALILSYTKDISKASQLKQNIAKQLTEGIAVFKSIHGNSLHEITSLFNDLSSNESSLYSTLGISKEVLYTESNNWIDPALQKLACWQNNIDKLKDWYQWLVVYQKMKDLNIKFIADEYKSKNIATDKILSIFNKSLYQTAINYILTKEPSLELFKGKIFNDTIERYKKLTASFDELTKKELYTTLAANIPSFTREAAHNSEVGILQRNIKNNARGISIRKLFDQIPTLLTRMCPCMLMSPISVAQYIDTSAEKFDLIVFDEASQMPTYEAIGAIARGKNVVIVGDPKQMPPTNFFSVNSVDEENIDMEDLESILDDCLALSIPSKYLLWHYRSKHESLISFSNSEYYDNKLLTFPSPDNIESKVKLMPIEGFYDKGRTRQNKAEAQAVVNEIARRLRDVNLRKRSIGVVTFSSVQQSLIEDYLHDLFMFSSELEKIALECEEPLFIKNLENVQGDERDIILFSVGYGPDSNGRVSMNFGPLNRLGGERRLNVAVTRARYEMKIYSTLRSDQIDLNRTSSIGVASFKRFLEYAERGVRIDTNTHASKTNVATVENLVIERLNQLGYAVHANIGSSGYKIDIGIVDKKNPSNYILGILCDGENYKRTKTARDREIVQNSVLKLLGWNICRIWTMDWWENQEEVINTICDIITKLEQKVDFEQVKNLDKEPEYRDLRHMTLTSAITTHIEKNKIKKDELNYKAVILPMVKYPSEMFYTDGYTKLIINQIHKVIETEAPISRSLLCKKILNAWGISRLGQRIDSRFDILFDQASFYQSETEGGIFCWNNKEEYESYTSYRLNSDRDAADLPPEEVANAMREIMLEEISLPTKDLNRLTAQIFGFARNGANVDAAMMRGLDISIRKEYLKIENDRAVII